MSKAKQKKVDDALDMTFPASDPPAPGRATGTEPPRRPASREAPRISKEQIERAAGTHGADRAKKPEPRAKAHNGDEEEGGGG
jgi:hypothetical protein